MAAGYWLYAERYYGFDKNPHRGDAFNLKRSLGILDGLYGNTVAKDFGPLDLRAIQGEMIRIGWCRNMVNHEVGRLKRVFRWAVSEEMVPASVWHGLLACPGLRKGKTEAPESEPVRPVPVENVEAVKPFLRPAVRALVDFLLLTGCRPSEACQLVPAAIDRDNPACWVFRPAGHKTAHHGHDRLVLVGPRAQAVVGPHLHDCPPDAWVFSPLREEQERNRARRENAPDTAYTVGHRPGRPVGQPQAEAAPRDCYTTGSLRRAIARACGKAGVPVFGPNRLRHTRATELRPHGLDVVGTILGHAKLETTQIYSEKNLAAAMALVAKVG